MVSFRFVIATSSLLDPCCNRVDGEHAAELMVRLRRALERYPVAPPLLYSMGLLCLQFGYIDLWEHYTTLALPLPHLTYQELVFRAEAKIRLGDWSGWDDREARIYNPREQAFVSPHARTMQWTTQFWNGDEDIGDKVLVVLTDGGFGDCIQMLRYVPELAHLAGRILLVVAAPCLELARYAVGDVSTVILPDQLHDFSFHRYVWLMSLPSVIGGLPQLSSLDAAPLKGPATDARRPRVGLCWAGNSNQPIDPAAADRPLMLDDLAPVLHRRDASFHSVQVGRWASERDRYPWIAAPSTPLVSFLDTAKMLASLDSVITVDTAVAHLAGSLGVPTFLLLHCAGEFRWGMDDVTPWYPSMRILRQPARGDWSSVVVRLSTQL
jgi:hypothetical protein